MLKKIEALTKLAGWATAPPQAIDRTVANSLRLTLNYWQLLCYCCWCCGYLLCLTQELCFQLHVQLQSCRSSAVTVPLVHIVGHRSRLKHEDFSLSSSALWTSAHASKSSVAFTIRGGETYWHHIYKTVLFIQQAAVCVNVLYLVFQSKLNWLQFLFGGFPVQCHETWQKWLRHKAW